MWGENVSHSWLFRGCYKAVSLESCLIMWNYCNINCRHHLLFLFFCRSSPSLMCWSAALYSFTLDPSVLLSCRKRLWLSLGNTVVLGFTKRLSGASWHDIWRPNCLPWAASSCLTPRLFFLQVKASFDGCGCYWYKMSGLYTSTCAHPLTLFKETVRKLKSSSVWAWTVRMDFCIVFYLLDAMLMKALAIYMQEKVLSSCIVFQQRRKSSCPQENQWFL